MIRLSNYREQQIRCTIKKYRTSLESVKIWDWVLIKKKLNVWFSPEAKVVDLGSLRADNFAFDKAEKKL